MKRNLETKLANLFIADSSLDDIKVFFLGEPYLIRNTDYPAVIIFVEDQEPRMLETGIWVFSYSGYLAVETLIVDRYEPQNRIATIDSSLTISNLLNAMTDLLQQEDNLALDNLTVSNEMTRVISVGLKTYGFIERSNNILNRGEVPFAVETQKVRT